jgi:hypothetical protein
MTDGLDVRNSMKNGAHALMFPLRPPAAIACLLNPDDVLSAYNASTHAKIVCTTNSSGSR